ncbi:GDYXXLXY domain-containing protein [Aidingimonas lacisalsi]|uniref:GDYXXLXY domain-containing protein n=1 Tax=Aidingimonas lacisalsi TaxID=2604086 RepID=UPI0011D1B13C|nr:GDYXXLXY domain-containing protein [Aidingimonas lacisalsi]
MNKIIAAAATLVILAVVNWAIWDKEQQLAEGEVVYLALAPVDPRSLMQGDYMALNFEIGNRIREALHERESGEGVPRAANGHVIVTLDEQRVAHFQRLGSDQQTLADDEMRLRYRVRDGRVEFATDAFFFQEGQAERYEPARYGRFRVNEQGDPLLVALYDDDLERLTTPITR